MTFIYDKITIKLSCFPHKQLIELFYRYQQVVFEGRRGLSWAGDIALDDISMQDGQCPPQLQCSFEDPYLCGWRNVHGDNFDWTRSNGYTASVGTGPSYDHTTGTSNGGCLLYSPHIS